MGPRHLLLFLLLIGLLYSASSLSSCQDISSSGVYILTSDLTASGDCITVSANDVHIQGNGHSITGDGTGTGIHIATKNVTVENLVLDNFEVGVKFDYKSDLDLHNLTIWANDTNDTGILGGSLNVKIYDNFIYGRSSVNVPSRGLDISFGGPYNISGNVIGNFQQAIYIERASNIELYDNLLQESFEGLVGQGNSNFHVFNNTFRRILTPYPPGPAGPNGYRDRGPETNLVIEDNLFEDFEGGNGVYVYSDYAIVRNNSFNNCTARSIYLFRSSHTLVIDNYVNMTSLGVTIDRSDYINVTQNHIFNSTSRGIEIMGNNHSISNNLIENSSGSGIYINSRYSNVSNNTIRFGEIGIYFYSNLPNNASYNSLYNLTYGIYLQSAVHQSTFYNSISNTSRGIHIDPNSNYNYLYGDIISDSDYGVVLDRAIYNILVNPHISRVNLGLKLSGAKHNRLIGANISNFTTYGVSQGWISYNNSVENSTIYDPTFSKECIRHEASGILNVSGNYFNCRVGVYITAGDTREFHSENNLYNCSNMGVSLRASSYYTRFYNDEFTSTAGKATGIGSASISVTSGLYLVNSTFHNLDYGVDAFGYFGNLTFIYNNTFWDIGSSAFRGPLRNAEVINNTIFDCGSPTYGCIHMYYGTSYNTTFDDLRILNSTRGIYVRNGVDLTFGNVNLTNLSESSLILELVNRSNFSNFNVSDSGYSKVKLSNILSFQQFDVYESGKFYMNDSDDISFSNSHFSSTEGFDCYNLSNSQFSNDVLENVFTPFYVNNSNSLLFSSLAVNLSNSSLFANSTNLRFEDSTFNHNNFTLYLYNSTIIDVSNSTFFNSTEGIVFDFVEYFNVTTSSFDKNEYGIHVISSLYHNFNELNFTNSGYGILYDGDVVDQVLYGNASNLYFYNNSRALEALLTGFLDYSNLLFEANDLAINLTSTSRSTFSGLNLSSNDGSLFVDDARDLVVDDVSIYNSNISVLVTSSFRSEFYDFVIRSAISTLNVSSGDQLLFDNFLLDSVLSSVKVTSTTDSEFYRFNITSEPISFILDPSDNNIIANSTIITSGAPALVIDGSNNTVYHNYIESDVLAINVTSGSNNSFYDNLINATNPYEDHSNPNALNTGLGTANPNIIGGSVLGGNYWANPLKTGFSQLCWDLNHDFICDDSYLPYSADVDQYPLTSRVVQVDPTNGSSTCSSNVVLSWAVDDNGDPFSCTYYVYNSSGLVTSGSPGSGVTSATVFLDGGNYSWYVECIIGGEYWNSTHAFEFTVLNTTLNLSVDPSWDIYINEWANVSCSSSPLVNVYLYRNGTLVASGYGFTSYNASYTVEGDYNFTCISEGDCVRANNTLHVHNLGPAPLNLTSYPDWSLNCSDPVNVTCSGPSGVNVCLYLNGSLLGCNSSIYNYFNSSGFAPGDYEFVCNTTGGNGYTNNSVNNTLSVSTLGPIPLNLTSESSWSVLYGTQTNVSCFSPTGENVCLYLNSSLVGCGSYVEDVNTYPVGSYFYVCNSSGSTCYEPNEVNNTLYVTSVGPAPLNLTSYPSWNLSCGDPVNVTCSAPSGVNVCLYMNSTLLGCNTTSYNYYNSSVFPPGDYEFMCNTPGGSGYTNNSVNDVLHISSSGPANISLISQPSWNVSYGTVTNVSCSDSSGLTVCLYRNDSLVNCNSGYVEDVNTLPIGSYYYVCNTTGSVCYEPNELNNTLYVHDLGPAPLNLTSQPSWNVSCGTTTNVSCSAPAGVNVCLYLNGTQLGCGLGYVEDVNSYGVGSYEYVCNTTGGSGYTSNEVNNTLYVDYAGPLPITLNADPAWSVLEGTQTNVSCWSPTGSNVCLYVDGGIVGCGPYVEDVSTYPLGSYTYVCNASGSGCYTDGYSSNILVVYKPSDDGDEDDDFDLEWNYTCPGDILTLIITNHDTGDPVEDARVYLRGAGFHTSLPVKYSDDDGIVIYHISVEGHYLLTITHSGYNRYDGSLDIELCPEEESPEETVVNVTTEPELNVTKKPKEVPVVVDLSKYVGDVPVTIYAFGTKQTADLKVVRLQCCLLGICMSIFGICWYWWVLLILSLYLVYRFVRYFKEEQEPQPVKHSSRRKSHKKHSHRKSRKH